MKRSLLVLVCLLVAPSAFAQAIVVIGPNSVLAFDVIAPTPAAAQGLTYAVTTDAGTPVTLTGITCVAGTPAGTQTCQAPVAQIPLGSHSLTMTSASSGIVSAASPPFAYIVFVIPVPSGLRFK